MAEVQRQDEASKWKYPAKGELPEDSAKCVIFIRPAKVVHIGYFIGGALFYSLITRGNFVIADVEKWQYAPEVEL
jgi:hypothetical protein